jgi:hypothetical protein
MKRLLLIGFAACTFALAPILSASAMPGANPNAVDGLCVKVHDVSFEGASGLEALSTMAGEADQTTPEGLAAASTLPAIYFIYRTATLA